MFKFWFHFCTWTFWSRLAQVCVFAVLAEFLNIYIYTYIHTYIRTYLQYGAWATSKKLPCMHKANYTPQSAYQIHVVRCKLYADNRRIGRPNTRRRNINIMTGGQDCYGRRSLDTPANRSFRSRHDDAELSSRGKRSNWVVHGPVE